MLKLLADVNIENLIIDNLIKQGYNVKAVININKRLPDEEIIKLANTDKRILLTNDKDFGEIVYRQKLITHGVILLRLPGQNEEEKSGILMNALSNKILQEKNFIVITKDKIRVNPLGDPNG